MFKSLLHLHKACTHTRAERPEETQRLTRNLEQNGSISVSPLLRGSHFEYLFSHVLTCETLFTRD